MVKPVLKVPALQGLGESDVHNFAPTLRQAVCNGQIRDQLVAVETCTALIYRNLS